MPYTLRLDGVPSGEAPPVVLLPGAHDLLADAIMRAGKGQRCLRRLVDPAGTAAWTADEARWVRFHELDALAASLAEEERAGLEDTLERLRVILDEACRRESGITGRGDG